MTNLIEILSSQLSGDTIETMSRQLGTNKQQTQSAISAALPLLVGALARNSASNEGASSLETALSKDHDGSILDNLSGFLTNANSGPGAGILKHVLGGKQQGAEQFISQSSGINQQNAGDLLKMLAPVLMGVLGKQKRQENLGADGLASMLNNTRKQVDSQAPKEMGLINQLLDKDGDGKISDDVLGMGMKFLGGILGGKR